MERKIGFQSILDVFVDHKRIYSSLLKKNNFILPLVMLVLCSAAVSYWYTAAVDFSWMVDHIIETGFEGKSKEEIEGFRSYFTHQVFLTSAMVETIGVLLILIVLLTAYFMFVGRVLSMGNSFAAWLSFVSWSYIPALLSYLAMAVTIAMSSDGQIKRETLDPLSLNSLVFDLGVTHNWYSAVSLISIPQLWIWGIMIAGFSLWSKKSMSTSAAIVLFPFALYALLTGIL